MASGDIIVRLIGDVRDLDAKFATISSKLNKLGSSFESAGKKLTSHVTLPLVGLGVVAFQSAAKLEDSMHKVGLVFGSSAAAVEKFASTSETSLGLSHAAALDATAQFGNMFEAMGIGAQKAEQMSTALVQLAADMSAFKGTSPEEALAAIQSGLAGNTRGLRQYGVVITQAQITQEAYKLGLITTTSATKAATHADYAISDAREQVATATRDAADRTVSAARAVKDADAGVKAAEDSLRSSQIDEKNAQLALTDAREAAKRSLEDLSLKVQENSLAEAQGVLRVKDARAALAAAQATGDQDKILRAQLDLKDAELSLTGVQEQASRDQEELNKRRKAGINGSVEMKAAQDQLAQSHKSVGDAQKAVSDAEQRAADARAAQAKTAQDNARSIADAERSVARAIESSAAATQTASAGLTPAAKAQAVYALLLQQTGKIHGEFQKRSKTATEQERILKAEFVDTAAKIGQKLLPAGLGLLQWAEKLLDRFAHLSPKTQDLILKFALAAAAIGPVLRIVGGVIKVFGGLMKTFELVGQAVTFLMANPVVAAVLVVALVVYEIIKHWKGISKWFKELWANIKHWFDDAVKFVVNLLLNFTPEGLIIKHWTGIADFFKGVWRDVKHWFDDAWQFVKNIFLNFTPEGLIIKHWKGIAGFFKGIWKDVKQGFSDAFHGISTIVKTEINIVIRAIDAVIDGLNTFLKVKIKVPKWVPLIGGNTIGWDVSIPKIPTLDSGAIVTKPTLALLAANSKPEGVFPLSSGRMQAGGVHVTYNITFEVPPTVNKAELGREIVAVIQQYERRSGSTWRAA